MKFLIPDIEAHLEQFTGDGRDSLVITGPKNALLRRSNFSDSWRRANAVADLDGVHFHDLRHTSNHIRGDCRRDPPRAKWAGWASSCTARTSWRKGSDYLRERVIGTHAPAAAGALLAGMGQGTVPSHPVPGVVKVLLEPGRLTR
jgi:integrase